MRVSRRNIGRKTWPLVLVLALLLAACSNGGTTDDTTDDNGTDDNGTDVTLDDAEGTLQAVRDRGELRCGVNDAVPGFGFLTPEGDYEGFDVDFCRAVAAAVLGDAEAVEYIALTAEARFTALQAGEIDVLIRNTTWTADRDGNENATFATTTFYDGQAMMVRADDGFDSLEDMDGTSICVLSGTTTELNLESTFAALDLDYEPNSFEDNDTLREAFLRERCDGWTSDRSQLAAFQSEWPEDEGGPEALEILDETMSKEPLGPATLDGDTEWSEVVNWAVIATIQAEEFEITSDNVEQLAADTDPESEPEVARFLGIDGFDPGLGLDADFAVDVVGQVGNYGEIFERNVGQDGLGLDRGLNALWSDGGLLYAPPYR